jgi:hypothetical protein
VAHAAVHLVKSTVPHNVEISTGEIVRPKSALSAF